jgi:hypothetical protein
MIRRLLLLALLSSCDSCLPESFRATPKAGFERMAAARLQSCVQNNPCQFLRQCFAESEAYCVDAGYSKTCGQMEEEGTCGSKLRP